MWSQEMVGAQVYHPTHLRVPAVSEVAEFPAEIIMEVREGTGQAGRVLWLCRPLAIVTVMPVTVVTQPVRVSPVAVAVQVAVPIVVVRVPAHVCDYLPGVHYHYHRTCIRSSCSGARRWPQAPPPRRRRERELQRPGKNDTASPHYESSLHCTTELTRYFMLVGRRVSAKCAEGWKSGSLYTNLACDALLSMLPMCSGGDTTIDGRILLPLPPLLFLAPQSSFRTSGDKTPSFKMRQKRPPPPPPPSSLPSWDRDGIRGMDTAAADADGDNVAIFCRSDEYVYGDIVTVTARRGVSQYFTVGDPFT